MVNEQKTSVKTKNYNQRGKRDMQSAKYIAQREGSRVYHLTTVKNWLKCKFYLQIFCEIRKNMLLIYPFIIFFENAS